MLVLKDEMQKLERDIQNTSVVQKGSDEKNVTVKKILDVILSKYLYL